MVDVVVGIIAIFYAGQSLDVIYRNHKELIRFAPIPVLLLALIPTYFISRIIFTLTLFFLMIMWSKSNRSESWGIEYHTLLIFSAAIALGPLAGLFLASFPLFLAPQIRKDMAIIDLIFTIFILGVLALLLGIVTDPTELVRAGVWAASLVVVHNIAKGILLYGKVDMVKLFTHLIVNIPMNYYLMVNVMPGVVQWILA